MRSFRGDLEKNSLFVNPPPSLRYPSCNVNKQAVFINFDTSLPDPSLSSQSAPYLAAASLHQTQTSPPPPHITPEASASPPGKGHSDTVAVSLGDRAGSSPRSGAPPVLQRHTRYSRTYRNKRCPPVASHCRVPFPGHSSR